MGRSQAEISKAIDIAIEVFRNEGYERTGIEDLVTATKLNRYAIYQQFGGKRELFLAALSRDSETMIEELKSSVENRTASIMATVQEFMNGPLEDIVDSTKSEFAGSLVCQAAFELAPHDKTIAENVHDLMNQKIAEMERIFQMAKDDNSLRPGIKPADAALLLMTTMYGLNALAQCEESQELLEMSLSSTFAILSA
ncbi:TetR/AcrR family transcriptional regulator [Hirschia maritima]|uniref:TetR/AcrR family transcriptional regulator n=1 Tax=Hirschia maritima TaxID=1121961 RepID=UPI00037D64B1|nr:TetR/AcrR family transcriptional regulator [Hirschia maritima]